MHVDEWDKAEDTNTARKEAVRLLRTWYGWIASGQLGFTVDHLQEAESVLAKAYPGFMRYRRPYACEENKCS